MRRPGRFPWDLRPLEHPLWWGALALLVANDHVFKRTGVLPRWLTGKLSDVAFLVVAPVLLAALLPRVLRRRGAVAVAAVTLVFGVAKLSPTASAALMALLRHCGVVWQLWPDKTDLMALAVLPVTAFILCRTPSRPVAPRRRSAGVVLGAIACVATSALPDYPHSPFLLNAAPAAQTFRVTWVLRAVPCGVIQSGEESIDGGSVVPPGVVETLAASLTPGDLGDAKEYTLSRGQVMPLDGEPPAGLALPGLCTTNLTGSAHAVCVAAILEAPPAAPVLMVAPPYWRESAVDTGLLSCATPPSPVTQCLPTMDPTVDAGPDAVTLKDVDGVLTFAAGAKLQIAPIDLSAVAARPVTAVNCRALRDQYASLLQPQSCVADSDCVALLNLPIPGPVPPCGIDANLAGGRALSALASAWAASCTPSPEFLSCSALQPAVCRNGICGEACPGEKIPQCPSPCYQNEGVPGTPCDTYCLRADGMVCGCTDNKVTCGLPPPTSATCPVGCTDYTGGGTYSGGVISHPPLDGGVTDAANGGAGGGGTGGSDGG